MSRVLELSGNRFVMVLAMASALHRIAAQQGPARPGASTDR